MKKMEELKKGLNDLFTAARRAPLDGDSHDYLKQVYKKLFENLQAQEAKQKEFTPENPE